MYTRWTSQESIQKLKENQEDLATKIQTLKAKNKTEQEANKLLEYEDIADKTKKRIKEKKENKIRFAHFKLGKNGRLEEELTNDALIKRARRIHKIKNKEETE